MEGVCEWIGACSGGCSSSLWPTTSGDLAQWVGAIGALLAVGVTAGFYFMDRHYRRVSESRAIAETKKERAYLVWMQSILASTPASELAVRLETITSMAAFAREMDTTLDREVAGLRDVNDAHIELRQALTDVGAFEKPDARNLLQLLSYLNRVPELIAPFVSRGSDRVLRDRQRSAALETLDGLSTLCHKVSGRMEKLERDAIKYF
jgi:hypothetical protein